MPRCGRNPDLERRQQVIALRSQGLTFKQIAEQLGVTRQAVQQLFTDAAGNDMDLRKKPPLTERQILAWADGAPGDRQGVVNARVIQERLSQPSWPRVMRRRSQERRRSVDRGTRRPAIELRNQAVWGADAVIGAEGNITGGVKASRRRTPRSRRPCACVETPCTGTGRSHKHPSRMVRRVGRRRSMTARPACTPVGSRMVA